jgi:hypothetical protein
MLKNNESLHAVSLGVIQIIRDTDTLGWVGVRQCVTHTFLLLETQFLRMLEVKSFIWKQE